MSSLHAIGVFIIAIYIIQLVKCSCEYKTTCHECILDADMCVWCSAESVLDRCKSNITADTDWCPTTYMERPQNNVSIESNKIFSATSGNVVQLKPQNMKMNLGVSYPQDFKFSFNSAEDYPVDLYILLDASLTMKTIKSTVAKQGINIYNTLKNLTKNVFMGLGTFIDKKAIPFTLKKELLTYSFKNELKLTDNATKFVNKVTAYKFGSNSDIPEGGFDALSQVMACNEQIGWRKTSRKIIVLMTDAPYHAAGDGMRARIVTPHDGKCYMENGTYTKELELDYPSVSLINKLAVENEFIVIFALTSPQSEHKSPYISLNKVIKGSKYVDITNIKDNSDDLTNTLKTIYENITNSIVLKTNFLDKRIKNSVDIKITPNCSTPNNNDDCIIQKHNKLLVLNFEASIKVLDYVGIDNFKVDIVPEGINERLTLDIDIIKDCKCEKEQDENSPKCHSGGTLKCGTCTCNNDRYGNNCRCSRNSEGTPDKSSCIDNTTNLECSGNGQCSCGICECNEGFEGALCNCNKKECHKNIFDGSLCSGHGKCECGICKCEPGWRKEACDCPLSEETCIDNNSASKLVCSGRGSCVCGMCKCNELPKWEVREQLEYCAIEECTNTVCRNRQCNALNQCIICLYNNENSSSECEEMCDKFIRADFVEILPKNTSQWNQCTDVVTKVGCYTAFLYSYEELHVNVLIQRKSDCMESYFVYGGISLGIVILIGLLTVIIWKLLTDYRDRKEYEHFKEQYSSAMWPEMTNPVYKPAIVTFSNPHFGISSTS